MLKFETSIGTAFTGRNNRFTPIRIVLASLVMLEHVFVVVMGTGPGPVIAIHSWSVGYLAVNGFFILSGFLIANSLERRDNLRAFVSARALRIMPALIALAVIATFIIGPLVSGGESAEYWTSATTWFYPLNVLFFADTSAGPFAVFPDNPAAGEFSATLWTLRYEVIAYAAAAMLFFTRILWRGWGITALLVLATTGYLLIQTGVVELPDIATHLGRFSVSFLLGMVVFKFRDLLPVSIVPGILFGVLAILLGEHPLAELFWNLTLASALFWAGFAALNHVPTGASLPDWSYGIYIWHYPVMQALWHFDIARNSMSLALVGIPITLLVAAVSWSFIERPSLALRRK